MEEVCWGKRKGAGWHMERGFAGLLGGWAHEVLPQLRPRSDILLPLSYPVSQIGLVGILHQIKEGWLWGSYSANPAKRVLLWGYCLSFPKTLLCCPPWCRCRAGWDISSMTQRNSHITPIFLHTQLCITFCCMLNSVVWPMLVFLSKYPCTECKCVLGKEKPEWWLWQELEEVTVKKCENSKIPLLKHRRKSCCLHRKAKWARDWEGVGKVVLWLVMFVLALGNHLLCCQTWLGLFFYYIFFIWVL